eukprot:CAMPEP_0118682186 /NCGR_PEP_ID=MMETSP0800-20121206/5351_1 /TAXON_ID=210618 ORGANISM="Striatella unipunctata, Strain CCMP2910" /NCGR_SAMPLE_ID=MMETSP0800 /ASSEMBLY_ACC=CAM_ASM_000638 /LENGTH=162 /DNA_ID=CAMNT_0006578559 /DNA_START=57 /DNA_END=545 /DNA_ORIENTATION=+
MLSVQSPQTIVVNRSRSNRTQKQQSMGGTVQDSSKFYIPGINCRAKCLESTSTSSPHNNHRKASETKSRDSARIAFKDDLVRWQETLNDIKREIAATASQDEGDFCYTGNYQDMVEKLMNEMSGKCSSSGKKKIQRRSLCPAPKKRSPMQPRRRNTLPVASA